MSNKLDAIKQDFKKFLYLIWKHLLLPDPTPVQYQIADFIQDSTRRRRMVQAFRGVGKSWITSTYVLWRLLNSPEIKILVVSASKQRADDFSTFTQRLIYEVPILEHLKPHRDQRFSKVAFDVGPCRAAHAPSVKSVGIFGQMTGSRADLIIPDDIENAQNALTQDAREKLIHAASEFEAILSPGGEIVVLGTPQTEETIYTHMREHGYQARIWPVYYPGEDKLDIYKNDLAPSLLDAIYAKPELVGMPVDPLRFSAEDLMEREAAYGRSSFELQFMLNTTLSDLERYPLRLSDLVVMDLDHFKAPSAIQYGSGLEQQIKELPNIGFTGDRFHRPMYYDKEDWKNYEGSILAIDPAGRGADRTGYAVVKQLHGKLFVTRAGAIPGGYEQHVLVQLSKIAKDEQVNACIIEANFGDGMYEKIFSPVLRQWHPCSIEEVKHSVQKEKRIIDTLEPVMNQHRLVVDKRVVEHDLRQAEQNDKNHSLFYQLTRLTRDRGALKHDDALDALSIAVNYWTEAMAKDELTSLRRYNEKLLDKELQTFMRDVKQPNHIRFNMGRNKNTRKKKPQTWTVL